MPAWRNSAPMAREAGKKPPKSGEKTREKRTSLGGFTKFPWFSSLFAGFYDFSLRVPARKPVFHEVCWASLVSLQFPRDGKTRETKNTKKKTKWFPIFTKILTLSKTGKELGSFGKRYLHGVLMCIAFLSWSQRTKDVDFNQREFGLSSKLSMKNDGFTQC